MEGTQAPGTDLVLVRPTGTKTRDWLPAVKCGATRSNGEPCGRWAVRGGDRWPVHRAQLPSVREAYARRVDEAGMRIVTLADPALDTLERALADKDTAVAVRAAQMVLDRVVPKPSAGVSVIVGLGEGCDGTEQRSPSEIIRERLAALRAQTLRPAPSTEPEAQPWESEPVEGELLGLDGS